MRTIFAALFLIGAALPASAQGVTGRYDVEGTNLDGSEYRGTAEVNATSDTTCTISWQTGGTTSTGICMRQEDVFVAGYRLGNAVGLVIYRWQEKGKYFDGTWTVAGSRGTGTERLIPR